MPLTTLQQNSVTDILRKGGTQEHNGQPLSVVFADLLCSHSQSSRATWVIMDCWSIKLITLANEHLLIQYFATIYIEKQHKQLLSHRPHSIESIKA